MKKFYVKYILEKLTRSGNGSTFVTRSTIIMAENEEKAREACGEIPCCEGIKSIIEVKDAKK